MPTLKSSASAELIIEVSEARRFISLTRMLFIVTAVRDQHDLLAFLVEILSTKMSAVLIIFVILEWFVS